MIAVRAAGIDTWSPCWYLDPESIAARYMSELATSGSGRGRLLPAPVADHRVGWFADSGMLYAEGHPSVDGLASPSQLPDALRALELSLLEADVPLPVGRAGQDLYGERFEGFGGVRRLDSTVDLAVSTSVEGLAVMLGIAAVARDMPGTTTNLWLGPKGYVETVALHGRGGGRLLGRVYDKGVESGTAEAGRLLRPEDQRRWPKDARRDVDELTGAYVREKFQSRFAPLWQATKGVTVGGAMVLAEKLIEQVQADELTVAQAQRLGGHLLIDPFMERLPAGLRQSKSTRNRLRRQLREHGLVLADALFQEVEVNLHDVLDQVIDTDAWERDG